MDNRRANSIFLGVIAIACTVAVLKIASTVMLPIFFSILLSFYAFTGRLTV